MGCDDSFLFSCLPWELCCSIFPYLRSYVEWKAKNLLANLFLHQNRKYHNLCNFSQWRQCIRCVGWKLKLWLRNCSALQPPTQSHQVASIKACHWVMMLSCVRYECCHILTSRFLSPFPPLAFRALPLPRSFRTQNSMGVKRHNDWWMIGSWLRLSYGTYVLRTREVVFWLCTNLSACLSVDLVVSFNYVWIQWLKLWKRLTFQTGVFVRPKH